ncbi:Integral membrane protein [Tenacibaculum discolor]
MEENKQEEAAEQSKQEIQQDAKGLWEKIKKFILELLDFRDDTDQEATIEAIKSDISFKGATAWILICSIFVASIGLNANSTAVVIGAMLISPLMGPILGVGMSIAINDIDTLRKSLTNLATMIVLSLLTAFLFFFIFPLREETSELLGRVRPDIRDVLIAFFGGLALIIARTKKGTIASVIFGVAIATALMPPLCTAGYGLAIGNFDYFLGAMYLFTINTIFIALATFLVLKLLGFTMIRYVNSAKRKRIAQIASFIAFLVMVPAVFTFVGVYNESVIDASYKRFLKAKVYDNPNLWLQREKLEVKEKTIKLFFNGDVSDATESFLRNELKNFPKIDSYSLVINENKAKSVDRVVDAYDRAVKELDQKDNVIKGLHMEIDDLKRTISNLNQTIEQDALYRDKNSIPFSKISTEAKIRFNDIKEMSLAKVLSSSDFIKVDTTTVVSVKWSAKLKDSVIVKNENELRSWIQKELKTDKIQLRRK